MPSGAGYETPEGNWAPGDADLETYASDHLEKMALYADAVAADIRAAAGTLEALVKEGFTVYAPATLTQNGAALVLGAGGAAVFGYRVLPDGDFVEIAFDISFGTGTITFAAPVKFSLPATVTRAALKHPYEPTLERYNLYDASATTNFLGGAFVADNGSLTVLIFGYGVPSITQNIGGTVPFGAAYAAGDRIWGRVKVPLT